MIKKERFRFAIEDTAKDEEHFHQDIELFYVLDGELDVRVEDKLSHLKTDDIFLVNSSRKHSFHTPGTILLLRLLINYQMISEGSQGGEAIFWCDSSVTANDKYDKLRKILRGMLTHYLENRDYTDSYGYLSDCYLVLEYLTVHFMLRPGDVKISGDADRYEERLRQINNYIYHNYDQPISMKELSEKLYLSNGYLSRFFKKNFGMSFAGYLTNVRIYHAADDLLYTDEPITRIAYNNGFTSAALFNKVFKKTYGQTPSDFRKQAARASKETDPAHQEYLEKRLEKMLVADEDGFGRDADENITAGGEYNVQFYEPLKDGWRNTISFSDASNLLHPSIREHLMLMKEALGFEYVRFWSLFTEEFFIRPDQEEYNFSQIDSVLDYVLELGMKPHIELGMKPKTIHYEIGDTRKAAQQTMDDFTPESWERLMRAFMRHLSHRYGQDVMDGWRMELWFDEDWRLDPENGARYLAFFDATWHAVKSCNENIRLGGYGIRMDTGFELRKELLRRWMQKEAKPDFLSIVFYAYERKEDGLDRYARRMTDNEAMVHFLNRELGIFKEAETGPVPVIISEWNLTPSVRNMINDSTFKGAYIIKNLIDTYGLTELTVYGAGSDRQYTSFDTPDLLFGGTGLLSKDGIMKPAAFAFDFMNRLFPYYIGRDEHCLITTDRHDNYAIVCHNQQELNYNYYLTPEPEIEKESMWKYYEGRKKLTLKIRLEGVIDGVYKIKTYRINDSSGSVLKIWGDMEYEKELSRNDLKYLRRACEPAMTIRHEEAHEGDLLIEEEMQPNEILLIRVRYSV